MRVVFMSALMFASTASLTQAQDITDQVQRMNKFGQQEQQRQESQQYQQYLKNNDFENGVSQRTGPTGSIVKGGGTAGYQWSTK